MRPTVEYPKLGLPDKQFEKLGEVQSPKYTSIRILLKAGCLQNYIYLIRLAGDIGFIKEIKMEKPPLEVDINAQNSRYEEAVQVRHTQGELISRPAVPTWRIVISLILLFLNYFLAQYDKFILSYFQKEVVTTLNLSSSGYGILSGYATGIVYALLALPTAYIADYTGARVWVLTISAIWWSICAVFQGLSHNFWQILLARIGMGLGQAPVEAISVSLISDLMGKEYVFIGERCVNGLNQSVLLYLGWLRQDIAYFT